jgi:hypothetical protein
MSIGSEQKYLQAIESSRSLIPRLDDALRWLTVEYGIWLEIRLLYLRRVSVGRLQQFVVMLVLGGWLKTSLNGVRDKPLSKGELILAVSSHWPLISLVAVFSLSIIDFAM